MAYPTTSPDKNAITSSLVPPIPVPTHGPGGNFSVLAKTHVNAPPINVLNAVRDTTTWPTWNTFCPSASISSESPPPPASTTPELPTGLSAHLEVGTICTIVYSMVGDSSKSSGTQGIEVTTLQELDDGRNGFIIAWKSTGRAHWQLHSERVMEFVLTEDGGTDYTCWETFGGLLGIAVKSTVGRQLADRFGDYARDVKGFAEAECREKNDAV